MLFSKAAVPEKETPCQLLCQTFHPGVFTEVKLLHLPRRKAARLAIHMTGEEKLEHFLFTASPNPVQGLHNSHYRHKRQNSHLHSLSRLFTYIFSNLVPNMLHNIASYVEL